MTARAALFDMDGLIIDSEPLWRAAEIACFAQVGLELAEDDCRQTMGFRLDEVIDYWYNRHPWESMSKGALNELIIDRMVQEVRLQGRMLPGVAQAVQLFGEMGFKLAVVSSSPQRLIQAVLETLDLQSSFHGVFSAEYEAYGKPHPQVYLSAATALQVRPDQCIVLEDAFHGVIAGKAAKMKVIAVPDAEEVNQPRFQAADCVLTSLTELKAENIYSLLR
ncbi:MAG: hexitol phosphatase HxpB [Cryomorphaceae bacterium]|nr:MAG: hexitol phosphatase HxpB [Cryomorphaceae bacterium]